VSHAGVLSGLGGHDCARGNRRRWAAWGPVAPGAGCSIGRRRRGRWRRCRWRGGRGILGPGRRLLVEEKAVRHSLDACYSIEAHPPEKPSIGCSSALGSLDRLVERRSACRPPHVEGSSRPGGDDHEGADERRYDESQPTTSVLAATARGAEHDEQHEPGDGEAEKCPDGGHGQEVRHPREAEGVQETSCRQHHDAVEGPTGLDLG